MLGSKKINIIIPAYNEQERISSTLQALAAYLKHIKASANPLGNHNIQTYIVDDGSIDKTSEIVEKYLREYEIEGGLLSYDNNKGKGYAVKYGMLNSPKADFYYLADADLASPWETLERLFKEMRQGDYDCVIGSRAIASQEIDRDASRMVSGKFGNLLIRTVLGLDIHDTQCGYKLFKQSCIKAFELQTTTGFGFDFEVLHLISKLGLSTKEVGIEWRDVEGSKVKSLDYVKVLQQLLKVRLQSYKIER